MDFPNRTTLTVPEAGKILGVGRDAAYAAAHRGEIPTIWVGRKMLVPVGKFRELLGLPNQPPA